MPFLGNSVTFRRFRVCGDPPSSAEIRAGFERYPFREKREARTEEANFGWVELGQAAKDVLTPIFGTNVVAASVRFDRKRINATAFALAFEARCNEIRQARGVERLGKNHKQEIKEALKEEMLAGVIPAVSLVDLVWDLGSSEVWIFTSSETTVDLIRSLFRESFGRRLYPDRFVDWMAGAVGWEKVEGVCAKLPGGSSAGGRATDVNQEGWHENDPMSGREMHISTGFLTHLLAGVHASKNTAEWWLEDRALFDNMDNGKTLVSGPGLMPDAPELEVITSAGKLPTSIVVGYRPSGGDSEWRATLKAGECLGVSGLKLPAVVKDGQEEMVFERHYLIDIFLKALCEEFVRYWRVAICGESNEGDGE